MIAASVAATNATLMAKGAANIGVTQTSDITGCGKCLAFADTQTAATGGYIMGNAATSATSYHYTTLAAFVKTEVDSDTIKGDACCKDTGTKESFADSATLCAKAATAYSATAKHSNIVLAANDFFQSALAKCPHNTTNCAYAGKLADGTTAITVAAADQRYLKLEKLGSVATLTIKVLKSGASPGVGTAPALL